jgi:hypothetical protein
MAIYKNLYAGLKSNLNWEKQFKNLDYLRKLIGHNPEILGKDIYYTHSICEEVVVLTNSHRSMLAKNAIVTLSELFELDHINLPMKYEVFFKSLFKKIHDKNHFLTKQSESALNSLLANCDGIKAATFLLDQFTKNSSKDGIQLLINCFSKVFL